MRTATIKELAYTISQSKKEGLPKPIVFLGAGASKTGGIPLAREIISDILEKYPDNPKITELSETERTYPKLMECLTPFERNKLLKGYIDEAKINVTHIYLAQLIREGLIDYVLTVNFDNLMLRALALYNIFPPTYDLAILKDLTTTTFKENSVLYLHGQHHGLWLLNTEEETAKVKDIIPPILNKISNQRPWIFVGYSGEDPIFEHIVKLGRFDNGLYWVCYNDNLPCENVCDTLLEKPNTNAYYIKGYDADSFMLKLNNELELQQPFVIDKPFTSLKKSIENIVDIDDTEHFKGVKERLEIVKKEVDQAIRQFEEGIIDISENLKEEINIDTLKKQVIDKIINENFEKDEPLEDQIKTLQNKGLTNLLANLYSATGNHNANLAKSIKDEILYKKSFENFEKAIELNPTNDFTYVNWGNAILNLAKWKKEETLFIESIEKYKQATIINSKNDAAFTNWGVVLLNLGSLKEDEKILEESIEKLKKAIELNPQNATAFTNWGVAIANLANLKQDEILITQSFEKFKKALELNPMNHVAFVGWGTAIGLLADLKKDEILFEDSFKKFEKATELNLKDDFIFSNWGNAILKLAKLTRNKEFFIESFKNYQKAVKLNSKNESTFENWSSALIHYSYLFSGAEKDKIINEAIEKGKVASDLGGGLYNLACAYALKNDKQNALHFLEMSLSKKGIKSQFVKEDDDWKDFLHDKDFINLLNKYSD